MICNKNKLNFISGIQKIYFTSPDDPNHLELKAGNEANENADDKLSSGEQIKLVEEAQYRIVEDNLNNFLDAYHLDAGEGGETFPLTEGELVESFIELAEINLELERIYTPTEEDFETKWEPIKERIKKAEEELQSMTSDPSLKEALIYLKSTILSIENHDDSWSTECLPKIQGIKEVKAINNEQVKTLVTEKLIQVIQEKIDNDIDKTDLTEENGEKVKKYTLEWWEDAKEFLRGNELDYSTLEQRRDKIDLIEGVLIAIEESQLNKEAIELALNPNLPMKTNERLLRIRNATDDTTLDFPFNAEDLRGIINNVAEKSLEVDDGIHIEIRYVIDYLFNRSYSANDFLFEEFGPPDSKKGIQLKEELFKALQGPLRNFLNQIDEKVDSMNRDREDAERILEDLSKV